jgi:Uma2 family endonuclease
MSTTSIDRPALTPEEQLYSGDRMSRREFHRLYEKTPDGFKAELIGGTVYVASPLKLPHGTSQPYLSGLFFLYHGATPGVELGDNTTVLLGDESEPQPDLFLRVLPECGGQSRTSVDEYVDGPPELVAEVAHSSRSIDLNAKRDDYARYGVLEYLVLNLAAHRLHWLDLQSAQELSPDPDGVVRLRCFPGLWIHAEALLAKDFDRLIATLQQGLASPEHAEFVRRLANTRQTRNNVGTP